jgi:hypothetical protein
MDELEEMIADLRPEAVWLDPFVELHGAEENDNTAVRAVMARFRLMARTHTMGLGILFHTRKGPATPGDPDAIRGASAIVGAGRIALTVTVMSQEEADTLGIRKENRRDFFRVDDAKKNYSRVEDAEWFERVEYQLDNGDRVAVPTPWFPPTHAIAQDTMLELERMIAQGSPVGPWSPRLGAEPRSVAHLLERQGFETKAAQTQALTQMKTAGIVEIATYKKARKTREDSPQGLRTRNGEPRSAGWWDLEDGENG